MKINGSKANYIQIWKYDSAAFQVFIFTDFLFVRSFVLHTLTVWLRIGGKCVYFCAANHYGSPADPNIESWILQCKNSIQFNSIGIQLSNYQLYFCWYWNNISGPESKQCFYPLFRYCCFVCNNFGSDGQQNCEWIKKI